MLVVDLAKPKAAAKHEPLFNNPASGLTKVVKNILSFILVQAHLLNELTQTSMSVLKKAMH
jgi:hypothetical protein